VTTAIVTVTTQVIQAPQPNTLQQTGAFVTQGGTTEEAGTLTQVATLAALEAILTPPLALESLSWSGNLVTGTTTETQTWNDGDVIPAIIVGAAPSGYNTPADSYTQITIVSDDTFTYPLTPNPGSETVPGNLTLGAANELLQMGTTYFAQNGVIAPYVLELGEGEPTAGVAALSTWLTDHPATVYSYLIPREWDDNDAFLTLLGDYVAPSKETYFYVTTTVDNRAVYANLKDVFALVESPGIPFTEFTCAAPWAVTLKVSPSSTNRVTPLSYATLFGVTPWPFAGNQTTFNELAAAYVNWVTTGAEGGLPSSFILKQGNMADGNPWNFWYAGDWCQINIGLALANEVINGSYPGTLAPLYYDQDGINRLQNRAVQVMQQAVAYGLAVGQVKPYQLPAATFAAGFAAGAYEGQLPVNFEPFFIYSDENPDDYAIGRYAGAAAVVTPLRGFLNLFFSLNITNLIAG
jgi:hypothetical protein